MLSIMSLHKGCCHVKMRATRSRSAHSGRGKGAIGASLCRDCWRTTISGPPRPRLLLELHMASRGANRHADGLWGTDCPKHRRLTKRLTQSRAACGISSAPLAPPRPKPCVTWRVSTPHGRSIPHSTSSGAPAISGTAPHRAALLAAALPSQSHEIATRAANPTQLDQSPRG